MENCKCDSGRTQTSSGRGAVKDHDHSSANQRASDHGHAARADQRTYIFLLQIQPAGIASNQPGAVGKNLWFNFDSHGRSLSVRTEVRGGSMKDRDRQELSLLQSLMAALQDTCAHTALCRSPEGHGWGYCDCALAAAMRKAEKQIIQLKKKAGKQ